MTKRIVAAVIIFFTIFIGSCIRNQMGEVLTINCYEFIVAERPLSIELLPEYRPLEYIVVINDDFDHPYILPSKSGETVSLGNGVWKARIALKPGQGVYTHAKVRVKKIK